MAIRNYLLGLPKWTAIYRCVKHSTDEIIVNSVEKPAKKRTFRVTGVGRAAFVAISITPLETPTKEGTMAKKRRKKAEEPEVEETTDDELEDLEDLDELDELEEEEPADEPDDEEDEDEEDEDEDLSDLSLKELRVRAKAAGMKAAKAKELKGDSGKKKLVKFIEANEGDDDDDEDEAEEAPKRKRGKKKGKGGNAPPTRELPKGKYGAEQIAEMVGKDARAVRVFLRKHTDEFPKDEDLGRYAFTKKEAQQVAKAMKKGSSE